LVTTRFKFIDGRSVEQVTFADQEGIHTEYRFDGMVIKTDVPVPPTEPGLPPADPGLTATEFAIIKPSEPPNENFTCGSPVATPLGEAPATQTYRMAAPPTRAERGKMGLIRGMYTFLFSLLGMVGAGAAALKDNLAQLTDLKWTTLIIVIGGALLAGIGYALKKYYKPDGLL